VGAGQTGPPEPGEGGGAGSSPLQCLYCYVDCLGFLMRLSHEMDCCRSGQGPVIFFLY
jgi:hypothetical protein